MKTILNTTFAIILMLTISHAQTWKPVYDYDKGLYGFEDEEGNRKDVKYKTAIIIDENNSLYSIVESQPKGDDFSGDFGIIDNKTLKFIYPLKYKNITIDGNILSVETKIDEYSFSSELFNKDLKSIYPTKIDNAIITIKNNLISFRNSDGKFGVLNETGKTIIPFEYEDLVMFDDNLFSVSKAGWAKHTIIDDKNKVIIPERDIRYVNYEKGFFIAEGSMSGKESYFVIDKTGKELFKIAKQNEAWITFNFDNKTSGCTYFDYEIKNDKGQRVRGLYDTKGTLVLPAEYYTVIPSTCNTIIISKKTGDDIKYGVYDVLTKKTIVPHNYYSISYQKAENNLKAYKDSKYSSFDLFDLKGNIIK